MAEIIFAIPDDQVDRVVSALADLYGYDEAEHEEITRADFVLMKLASEVASRVQQVEGERARVSAVGATPPAITVTYVGS